MYPLLDELIGYLDIIYKSPFEIPLNLSMTYVTIKSRLSSALF